MDLATGKNVIQPDNNSGDILELIWRDSVLMENKNGKLDLETLGKLVANSVAGNPAGDSAGDSGSERKGSEVKGKEKKGRKFVPPTVLEISEFAKEKGYEIDAQKIFDYYDLADWTDSRGNKVKNWKQKINGVWFKPECKKKPFSEMTDGEKISEYNNLGFSKMRSKYGHVEAFEASDMVAAKNSRA